MDHPFLGYYHSNDKTIHDFDDRTQVYLTNLFLMFGFVPCLFITLVEKIKRGTEFRINLNSGLDKQVILTNPHCLFIPGWDNLENNKIIPTLKT